MKQVGSHFGSHGYTIYLLVMLTIKGKIVDGKHQLSKSDQNRSGQFLVRAFI
jgi:hypothetical protein